MRIVCNKCDRKMNIGELLPHVGEWLVKLLAPTVGDLFWRALQYYLSLPTKSWTDDSMAGLANVAQVKCPNCKKKTCWNPDPEIEITQEQSKEENITIE